MLLWEKFLLGSDDITLIDAITISGLTSGLKICLDAGDHLSYTSGEKWLDRSGNGNDYFLGPDATTTANPTFNGGPGGASIAEYWSFNGSQYFRMDSTVPSWVSNLHKDGAKFSWMAAVYFGSSFDGVLWSSRRTSPAYPGMVSFFPTSGRPSIAGLTDGGETLINGIADNPLSLGQWYIVGGSIEETGGIASFLYRNGGYDPMDGGQNAWNGAYSSSPTIDTNKLDIAGSSPGSGDALFPTGSRLAFFAFWEGLKLTKIQMDSIYSLLRGRFGI